MRFAIGRGILEIARGDKQYACYDECADQEDRGMSLSPNTGELGK
jgi:hypothetical protein